MSFPGGAVDFYLNKRHLPSSQVERVPNVEELEGEEIDADGPVSSLRAANFMPPGVDLGVGTVSPAVSSSLQQSPLFSPVFAQLAKVNKAALYKQSDEAQKMRRKLLRGSNVLIVQGGYSGKRFIYDRLKELGVNVTIMDGPDSYWKTACEEGLISDFVEIDFSDQSSIFDRAIDNIFSIDTKFDVVTTYYEDAVPLATRLATAMGFDLNPVEACDLARNKRRTREAVRDLKLPSPAFTTVQSMDAIEEACKLVGFPAVLKPAFGASSLGVFKVRDVAEAKKMFGEIERTLRPDLDSIWTQGTEIIMEEYYDGDEFDVDLLLFEGKAVYAKLADNWKCHEPWFQETGLNMPSFYPEDRIEQLVQLALDATIGLGFRYGAFHVEVKWTSRGPRLIEINARMGGVSVRDSNLGAWGVDLVEEHMMAMLKIPINPNVPDKYLSVLTSIGLITPYTGVVNSDDWMEALRSEKEVVKLSYEKKAGERVTGPKENLPDWLGEVRCRFDSKEHMSEWIRTRLTTMKVPIDADDAAEVTGFFLPVDAHPFTEPEV